MSIDQHLAEVRATFTRVTPREAVDAVERGAILIDIRPESTRRAEGEIPGAIVIERNHLEWRLDPSSRDRIDEAVDENVQWILFCDEGYASSLSAAALHTIGVHRATDVIGGFKAWRAERLPVRNGTVTPPRLAGKR